MKVKSSFFKGAIIFAFCAILCVSMLSLAPFKTARAESTSVITIAAPSDTLSGTATLTLTKTLGDTETEAAKPLEVYVDLNLVYKGAYVASIDLNTTMLANGDARVIKAVYTTDVGAVQSQTTVKINNAISGVDPVTKITPTMMNEHFSINNNSPKVTKSVVKINGIDNLQIVNTGGYDDNLYSNDYFTLDFGTAEDVINPIMKVKTSQESADGAGQYDIRLRVRNYLNGATVVNETDFDYLIAGSSLGYNEVALRQGTNAPATRKTAVSGSTATLLDIMLPLRSAFTLNVEYITIECYKSTPIAIAAGAPIVNAPSTKNFDKFSSTEYVSFSINTNANVLTALSGPFAADGTTKVDAELQIESQNYTLAEGTTNDESVTIDKDYLKTLTVGSKYFKVATAAGNALVCVNVVDSTPIPVASATITNKLTKAYAGGTHAFTGSFAPTNATTPTTVWSVNDSAVATINAKTGAIKFLKAGSVTVTLSVSGKTVTGAADTAKTDTCVITVSEYPVVPVITAPIYNAYVKNGLLVKTDKQVNDATDALKTMRIYFGGVLVYEGAYAEALGIDTTVFANQNAMLDVEFETVSGLKSRTSVPVIIENESLKIFNPTLEQLAAFTSVDNANASIKPVYDEFNAEIMTGVEFKATEGVGHFFSNTFIIDGTKADDIVLSFNVRKFTPTTSASKLTAQMVFKPFGSIVNDTGVYTIIDITSNGYYSISLRDVLDRELDANRITQVIYDAIMGNNNAICYMNLFAENAACGEIDNLNVNYKFNSTNNSFAAYDVNTLSQTLKGGTLKYSYSTVSGKTYYVATASEAGAQSEGSKPTSYCYLDFGTSENPINPFVTLKTGEATSNFDLRFRVEGETDFDYMFEKATTGGTKNLRTAVNAPESRKLLTGIKKVEFFISLRAEGYVQLESIAIGSVNENEIEVIADLSKTVVEAVVEGEATKKFDLYTDDTDVEFTINSDGLDVVVSGGGITNAYYTFEGKSLKISASYLSALEMGEYTFSVTNGVGEAVTVSITVTDSRPEAPIVTGEATKAFDKTKPSDVAFTVDLKGSTAKVTGGGITSGDYTLENGILTIKKEFLATTSNGTRTFTITTDGGVATVKIEVSASVVPKGCGGCSSTANAAMLLILPLLAGAGLIIKRR